MTIFSNVDGIFSWVANVIAKGRNYLTENIINIGSSVVYVKSTSNIPDVRAKNCSTSKVSVATQISQVSKQTPKADKSTQTSALWDSADEKVTSAGPTQLQDHLRVYLGPSGHWEGPTDGVYYCMPKADIAGRAGKELVDANKPMERNLYTIWEDDGGVLDDTFIDRPFSESAHMV